MTCDHTEIFRRNNPSANVLWRLVLEPRSKDLRVVTMIYDAQFADGTSQDLTCAWRIIFRCRTYGDRHTFAL